MKIEKIHSNKIKVTFTPEDLIEHNITPEAVRDHAPGVNKVLMMIFDKAQEEMGFEVHNSRLMVEAMPAENDTLVMYITKLEGEEVVKEAVRAIKRNVKLKARPIAVNEDKIMCVTFSDFEDAVKLAHLLTEYDGGELYFYEGRYHLIISTELSQFASEFGLSGDETVCYIVSEHGKLVCDNALSTLRSYF